MRHVASRVVSTKLSDPTSDFRPFVQLSGGITVRTCKRESICGPRHPIDCGFHWGRSPDHIIPPMADRGKRNTASDRSPRIERAQGPQIQGDCHRHYIQSVLPNVGRLRLL